MAFEPDNAVRKTREYLDSFIVEQRLIDSVVPSQNFNLYGKNSRHRS
ncbi:MAG: hypothetical protein PUC65_15725 [Clostridiales bacterium]|nr:hypothetical protein [Clostridiales bacterium]